MLRLLNNEYTGNGARLSLLYTLFIFILHALSVLCTSGDVGCGPSSNLSMLLKALVIINKWRQLTESTEDLKAEQQRWSIVAQCTVYLRAPTFHRLNCPKVKLLISITHKLGNVVFIMEWWLTTKAGAAVFNWEEDFVYTADHSWWMHYCVCALLLSDKPSPLTRILTKFFPL